MLIAVIAKKQPFCVTEKFMVLLTTRYSNDMYV